MRAKETLQPARGSAGGRELIAMCCVPLLAGFWQSLASCTSSWTSYKQLQLQLQLTLLLLQWD